MNIFYIHDNPRICATAMTDKHIVKMILESAQLMSTAHRVLDGQPYIKLSKSGARLTRYTHDKPFYHASHINHPSGVWVRESQHNYQWLYEHFLALNEEYTKRYNRTHKSYTELNAILRYPPKNVPVTEQRTPMRIAITDTKWHRDCPIDSYRAYYIGEKLKTQRDLNRFMSVIYGG